MWLLQVTEVGRESCRAVFRHYLGQDEAVAATIDGFGDPADGESEDARVRLVCLVGRGRDFAIPIDPSSAWQTELFLQYVPYTAYAQVTDRAGEVLVEINDGEDILVFQSQDGPPAVVGAALEWEWREEHRGVVGRALDRVRRAIRR